VKPGIYSHIANADYHGGAGVSVSMLKVLHEKTPAHLKAARDVANDNNKDDEKISPALMIGTAFHALVLEPEEFAKTYCLPLRQQDVPDAIEDREQLVSMVQSKNLHRENQHKDAIRDSKQLVAMIEKLNETRLPKLQTSGSKAELIARIYNTMTDEEKASPEAAALSDLKTDALKALIEKCNETRPGHLPTSGSVAELAQRLRDNGVQLKLWSEVCEDGAKTTGVPYVGNVNGSRQEMADWLRANGQQVRLWSEVKEEWQRNNAHRIVLTQEQWDQVHGMAYAVKAHPAAGRLLSGKGYAELSAYAHDETTGQLRRVRPDFWRVDGIVVDLKSTEDASPEGFARSIAKYAYDMQHPYYLDTLNDAIAQQHEITCDHPASAKSFVFIAVEKSFPYAVAVYALDDESTQIGRAKCAIALQSYAECEATGVWPAYSGKVETISLPQWNLKQNSALLDSAA